jgi:hypothetical protein
MVRDATLLSEAESHVYTGQKHPKENGNFFWPIDSWQVALDHTARETSILFHEKYMLV